MNTNKFDAACEIFSEVFLDFLISCEDFCDAEVDAYDFARKVSAKSLSTALEHFDNYLYASGEFGRVKSKESRTIITKCGEVTFKRRRFVQKSGSHIPADEILALSASSRLSPLANFEITTLACDLSYQKTSDAFERLSGVKISKPAVGEALCSTAEIIKNDNAIRPKRKCLSLAVEGDGVWIALQHTRSARWAAQEKGCYLPRKQEVGLGCVYEGKTRSHTGRNVRVNPSYTHSLTGHNDFWEHVCADIEARYCQNTLTTILLGTDAEAGYVRGRDYLPGRVIHSLDRWHVFRTVRVLAGTDISPEIIALLSAKRLDGALLHLGGYRDVFRQDGEFKRAKDIQKLMKYLVKWQDEILNGLSFSLGSIEGSISHVVAARCKTLGRAWSKRRLDAVITCLTHMHSGNELPKRRRSQEVVLRMEYTQRHTDKPAMIEVRELNASNESHYYHQTHFTNERVRSSTVGQWDTLKKIF